MEELSGVMLWMFGVKVWKKLPHVEEVASHSVVVGGWPISSPCGNGVVADIVHGYYRLNLRHHE